MITKIKTHRISGIAVVLAALPISASVASADIQQTGFFIDLIEQDSKTNSRFIVPMQIETADLREQMIFVLNSDMGWGSIASQASGTIQLPSNSDLIGNQFRTQQISGLDAVTKPEDNLNIVPLPTAAIAGLGLLSGLAGVRYMRRHK
ncbi:MAG: hypothetical protein P1U42_12555 [Phycisphaerales bacterium]|nr:hypothetical protein [Phycisphaerales bacterium]